MCAECPSLWMKARLQLTFFCYKPFCFCVFFIFLHDLHAKSRKVCQKTRSALPQASVPCKGQCTKHTTAKRPFVARIHHFYIDHNAPCLLHKSFVKQWWISSGDVSGTRLLSGVTRVNRTLPGSKNPHLQNEARCTTFPVKMSFICMRMKNDFRIKGRAPTLVLKQRPWGTRKWRISRVVHMLPGW